MIFSRQQREILSYNHEFSRSSIVLLRFKNLGLNQSAGQAATLTNPGAILSNVGSKLVAAEFANAWEAQSVCRFRNRKGRSRGNNFTLLGWGNTNHS